MPTLADYRRLSPFSIDELVDAVNAILRDRPRMEVSKRTVRYYVALGTLPAPRGTPKFARYEMEHLVRLVGARCLQDRGKSLDEAKEQVDHLLSGGLEDAMHHVDLLALPKPSDDMTTARTADRGYETRETRPTSRPTSWPRTPRVTRLQLTEGITLEFEDRWADEEALLLARMQINELLEDS